MMAIVIISFLVAILAPSVNRSIQLSQIVKTQTQIQNLERGLEAFKMENRFYPGQTEKTGRFHTTAGGPSNTKNFEERGSEFLVRALWMSAGTTPSTPGTPDVLETWGTYSAPIITAFNEFKPFETNTAKPSAKTSDYSAFEKSMLITTDNNVDPKHVNAISDGFGKPMPILYFVADLSKDDLTQYDCADMNMAYPGAKVPVLSGADTPANRNTAFKNYMTAKGLWPKAKDRYVLIAPGMDRKYFQTSSTTKSDDVTN